MRGNRIMKKALPLLLLASLFALRAEAQITQNDMPTAGDTIRFGTTTPGFGFSVGNAGQNQTWDFSDLTANSTYLDEFVTTSSTEITYSIVFGLPFSPNYAPMAKGEPFPIALPSQLGVSLEDVFNFYKTSSSAFTLTGFGASVNGFPIPVQYQDGLDELVPLPLNYNTTGSSSFRYEIAIPSLGFYGRNATRNNIADGTGTLILPDSTFQNVIRLKSTQVYTDSIYIDQFGFGLALPEATEVKYKFLSPGNGWPLMEITANSIFGQEIISRVAYRVYPEIDDTGIPQTAITGLEVYPNPASEILICRTECNHSGNLTYQMFDVQGKLVHEIRRENAAGTVMEFIPLQTLNLQSGLYFVKITDATGNYSSRPVMIQKP